ncbi:MAG: hypothetical protein QM493_01830 [Sulfurovum sp.]
MSKILKEIYGLEYKPNIIMDILWLICLGLIIKDIIFRFVLKRSYGDEVVKDLGVD